MENPSMMIEPRKQNGDDVESSSGDIASDNGDVSFRDGGPHSDESSTHTNTRNRSAARNLGFSETEQKIVNYGRFAFLFCLLSSAAALAVTVYYIGKQDEEEDFDGEVSVDVMFLDGAKNQSHLYGTLYIVPWIRR